MGDEVTRFYDELSETYHLFFDWRHAVSWQGEALDRLIRSALAAGSRPGRDGSFLTRRELYAARRDCTMLRDEKSDSRLYRGHQRARERRKNRLSGAAVVSVRR